jgi:GNAT superfamily N-acetyltransferase
MNHAIDDVVPEDALQVRELIARVITQALSDDDAVQAGMIDNALGNLDWAMAHPQQCCHLKCSTDGRVVGIILVKNFWNLCSLFVATDLHRRGMGRALVAAAMDRCRGKSEKNALWLNAATPAVPFYASLGFKVRATTQVLPPGFQAMQLPL